MQNFAAIDFETANEKRTSICSVGLVICRHGQLTEYYHELIRPYPFVFNPVNISIHNITPEQVKNAPTFPEVWSRLIPKIGTLPLVAHNRSFDRSCLQRTCEHYHLSMPNNNFYCTYQASCKIMPQLSDHCLDTLSRHFGLKLNHHNALSDAEACARLALRFFPEIGSDQN